MIGETERHLPRQLVCNIGPAEETEEKLSDQHCGLQLKRVLSILQLTNKYGRGTERHLPKPDESVVRPAGERR